MLPGMTEWCRQVNDVMFVRGIKMGQLASMLDMTREYVSSVVHGRHYSKKVMRRISELLDIPFDEAPATLSTL